MENNQYKGFAYANTNKPTIVYGTSPEDILAKLNSYNLARTAEYKFKTCNIGQLDMKTSKYGYYHKYDVATGKDISSVYLQIPALKKDEFQKVVADLNTAGARFNPYKKKWYITADQNLQKFQDICNQFSKDIQSPERAKQQIEQESDVENGSGLQADQDVQIEGVDIQYAVKLANRRTVTIPVSALGVDPANVTVGELLDKLGAAAAEQLRNDPELGAAAEQLRNDPEKVVGEIEYSISVSRDSFDNRCTVWFNDGRDPINLRGDAYGLHFPTMASDAVADFVTDYLRQQEQPELRIPTEYRVGDRIDCYIPLRLQDNFPNQPIYVENISHIVGGVQEVQTLPDRENASDVEAKFYEIVDEDGNVQTIRSDEIYAPDQARVLLRAAADELTGVQFDLLADKRLSAAQMEEIRFGFKDGLATEQVALYANPEMTPAEMDLCRIGLNSGLGYAEISMLLKETKELSYTDSRNRLNEVIKEHREQALESEPVRVEQAETADFYGTEVPLEDGKRMIPQEAIDGLLTLKDIENPDFTNCIFRGIDFSTISYNNVLSDADFSNSGFYDCKFDDLDMRRSSFKDAALYRTSFMDAILTQCDFSKSYLSGINFGMSDVLEVNFSKAEMNAVSFSNCAMEKNDFYMTQMDTVNVYTSCDITADQKHLDTVQYTIDGASPQYIEKTKDMMMWRLSGSEITYERKEELLQLFNNERSGDSESREWREDLTYEESKLVDGWDQASIKEGQAAPAASGVLQQIKQDDSRMHICEDITKSGYKPTEKLISNIQKLDAITGERHSLKDVVNLYRQNNFQNNQELSKAVLDIAEECKQQELAKMAAPEMNVPG